MNELLHIESIYGGYHGMDPRCFQPDEQCCTEQEIANWKAAVKLVEEGGTFESHAGCHVSQDVIACNHGGLGIGIYQVVMTKTGDYIRNATFEDAQRESEWQEDVDLESEDKP